MELVHEPIIERSEVLKTFRARLLEFSEKEDLSAGVELLKKLAQLSHRITTGWDAQDIMDEAFYELLGHILRGQIAGW